MMMMLHPALLLLPFFSILLHSSSSSSSSSSRQEEDAVPSHTSREICREGVAVADEVIIIIIISPALATDRIHIQPRTLLSIPNSCIRVGTSLTGEEKDTAAAADRLGVVVVVVLQREREYKLEKIANQHWKR